MTDENQPFFTDISSDAQISEIESLCMNCHENGVTRLMLTKIPFFRQVIVMAFSCPHCHFRSSEVQSAGTIEPLGSKFEFHVETKEDLGRMVVKQNTASVTIPELDFEIPANTQKGKMTTIEGLLCNTIEGLQLDQDARQQIDPEVTLKIAQFIQTLHSCIDGETPFTFILDDPSGNSFVENPLAPKADPRLTVTQYKRSVEHNQILGLPEEENAAESEENSTILNDLGNPEEVIVFPGNCHVCKAPAETRMFTTHIPHFKDVVLMASTCNSCGAKSTEVKSSGAISEKGKKIVLKMTDPDDLNRDILKSETASVHVPEIELELEMGTLGGKFSTIEGLLSNIKDQLVEANPFGAGDSSAANAEQTSFRKLITNIDSIIQGEKLVTIILDDPLANSYIQNVFAPDEDPEMEYIEYERTQEQNDELGISDLKTENYEEE
eukprot:GCRY01000828.1.p1 GENE.GCRY01000828.1~~GCRY01000828.1.p1  ORF type:complete len:438 (-),score=84.98 GCRY01000828.1:36-1349(-)